MHEPQDDAVPVEFSYGIRFEVHDGYLEKGNELGVEVLTLEQAKARCSEWAECHGFCFNGPSQDGEPMEVVFKSKFELVGENRASGWCSYHVRRAGQAPGMADQELEKAIEELDDAELEARFTMHQGFIPEGHTLFVKMLTIKEAMMACAWLPYCHGFTFEGEPTDEPVEVFFKSKWELAEGPWTSYHAEQGVFHPTVPRALGGGLAPTGQPDSPRKWVLVCPVKGLCNRLRALVAAMMLAEDLGREVAILWRNAAFACNCPWDRIMEPTPGLHVVDKQMLSQHDALRAGVELINLWSTVCNSANDPTMVQHTVERFDTRHRQVVRSGLACFVDVFSTEWRQLRRVKNVPSDQLPECLKGTDCIAVRAYNWFYPATEHDRQLANEDRSFHLRRLVPAAPVAARVFRLPPGMVSVHVRRTDHKTAILHSPDELFTREMDLRCASDWRDAQGRKLRAFFLATDDPEVEESFRKRYGEMVVTYEKRTLKRNEGDGIEDAFVDLLLLAQGSEVIGSFRSSFSAMAALFHSVPLHIVNEESVGTADFGGYKEVPLAAADPWRDRGKFYLVGSWDDWKNFTELRNVGVGHNSVECSARVTLGDTAPREAKFQIVRDKDWMQRFYPSEDGTEILGPSNAHGSNWQAKVPPKAKFMRVTFSPKGAWRTLQWKFFNYGNKELPPVIEDDPQAFWCDPPKQEPRSGPTFFVVGSWDDWTFTELPPRSTRDAICCCRVRLQKPPGRERFQIVEERSWARRYFPSGSGIEGPSDKSGLNWEVQIPKFCSHLEVIWDPRGSKKVEWNFVDDRGCYMELQASAQDFALIGSWNDWGEPSRLRPARNGLTVYRCRVALKRAPAVFEFMVIEDGNDCRCFFPMQSAKIIAGPCRNDQHCHWRAAIPGGCHFLEVTWDPHGDRSLSWRFLGRSGVELS